MPPCSSGFDSLAEAVDIAAAHQTSPAVIHGSTSVEHSSGLTDEHGLSTSSNALKRRSRGRPPKRPGQPTEVYYCRRCCVPKKGHKCLKREVHQTHERPMGFRPLTFMPPGFIAVPQQFICAPVLSTPALSHPVGAMLPFPSTFELRPQGAFLGVKPNLEKSYGAQQSFRSSESWNPTLPTRRSSSMHPAPCLMHAQSDMGRRSNLGGVLPYPTFCGSSVIQGMPAQGPACFQQVNPATFLQPTLSWQGDSAGYPCQPQPLSIPYSAAQPLQHPSVASYMNNFP